MDHNLQQLSGKRDPTKVNLLPVERKHDATNAFTHSSSARPVHYIPGAHVPATCMGKGPCPGLTPTDERVVMYMGKCNTCCQVPPHGPRGHKGTGVHSLNSSGSDHVCVCQGISWPNSTNLACLKKQVLVLAKGFFKQGPFLGSDLLLHACLFAISRFAFVRRSCVRKVQESLEDQPKA